MPARTIAIGDIHGCSKALKLLIDAIQPESNDTIVTLGDYVDRGPDTRGVIDQLIALASRCRLVPLLGNHEIMMSGAGNSEQELEFWTSCGGQQTLESYGGSLDQIPQDHRQFLSELRHFHESDTHFFVHANYLPDVPLSEQPESIMFWEHVTNKVPEPHQNGKIAVVGHTPQTDGSVRDVGHLILLDTFCFGGMWLSAIDFTNGVVWQSDQEGQIFEEQIPVSRS